MNKEQPGNYPLPPPSYDATFAPPPQPSQPPTHEYVTSQVIITSQPMHFGPDPQLVTCPHCLTQMNTRVKSEATTKTHIAALILFCFLCWPCAWVPYCCDSCQNRVHYCSSCGKFLGVYDS